MTTMITKEALQQMVYGSTDAAHTSGTWTTSQFLKAETNSETNPTPKHYTAYGVQYASGHGVECTCQICGHCATNGTHDYINHVPLISTIPQFPPPDLKLYCPLVECVKYKYDWQLHQPALYVFRTFKSRHGLTQHLNRIHPGVLSGTADYPTCPPATAFGVTLEQGVYLETLWGEASTRKVEQYSIRNEAASLGGRDISTRLAAIYMGIELALDNPSLRDVVDAEINRTMAHILNYFVMSTMGEARYLNEIAKPPTKRASFADSLHKLLATACVDEAAEQQKQFTVWLTHHFLSSIVTKRTANRFQVWEMGLDIAKVVGYEKVLVALEFLFNMPGWGTNVSVGGRKWGTVARHGLKFVRQEESPLMALDSIVDVVHNGGWALNKYYLQEHHCPTHHTSLANVLNIKQQSAFDLLPHVCLEPWMKGIIANDLHLITRYLPYPDSETKWHASESFARLQSNIPHTIPKDTLAHLECAPIWRGDSDHFIQWLTLFGDASVPVTNSAFRLWQELIIHHSPAPDCPVPFSQFKGWYDAHQLWYDFDPNRYNSYWIDSMAEFISNFASLEDATLAAESRKQSYLDEVAAVRASEEAGVSYSDTGTPEFVAAQTPNKQGTAVASKLTKYVTLLEPSDSDPDD